MSEKQTIIIQIKHENISSHEANGSLLPISEVFKDVAGFETRHKNPGYSIRATIPADTREEFEKIASEKGYSVRDESPEDRTAFKVPNGTGIRTRTLRPSGSLDLS